MLKNSVGFSLPSYFFGISGLNMRDDGQRTCCNSRVNAGHPTSKGRYPPSPGVGSSTSGPLCLSDWRRVSRASSLRYLPGLVVGLDVLEGRMKPSIHHRVLGHIALAAVYALAAMEGIAPWGWPLRYGQRLGPLLPHVEVVAGLLAVILPPWRYQSGSEWWLHSSI